VATTLGHPPYRSPRPDEDGMDSRKRSGWAGRVRLAVFVVVTPPKVESEGSTAPSLPSPSGKDELVSRVAAANPRTIAW